MIRLHVPSLPKAQPRARATARGHFARMYTPKSDPVNTFKAAIQHAAGYAYDGGPIDEPIKVDVWFIMPRPTNKIWKRRAMPRYWHHKKPDVDNMLKAVLDALNGLLWRDDALIGECVVRKQVAAGDEQPHCVIEVSKLNAEQT